MKKIALKSKSFDRENPNLQQDMLQLENMHEQLLQNQEVATEVPQLPENINNDKEESEDVRE